MSRQIDRLRSGVLIAMFGMKVFDFNTLPSVTMQRIGPSWIVVCDRKALTITPAGGKLGDHH